MRRIRDLAARLALTCSEPGVAMRCSKQLGGAAITDCLAQP